MAATVIIQRYYGAGPTTEDVTGDTLRFKRAADVTQDANDPVPIPSSGDAFSWRVVLKAVVTVAPETRCTNLRMITNGASVGTGRAVLYARTGSYVQPSAADEDTAIGGTDAADIVSGSPEVIQAGTWADGADPVPNDGGVAQDYSNFQLKNTSAAQAGLTANPLVVSFLWDET